MPVSLHAFCAWVVVCAGQRVLRDSVVVAAGAPITPHQAPQQQTAPGAQPESDGASGSSSGSSGKRVLDPSTSLVGAPPPF